MCDLFKFGGLSAAESNKNGIVFGICGKVNLRHGRKNVIGYIIDERDGLLEIKIESLEDNIYINRPVYNRQIHQYDFNNELCDKYLVSDIWPIRLKLNTNGMSSILFSIAIVGKT